MNSNQRNMKIQLLILCVCVLSIMACDNPMTFRTKVNEDGSLDKSITLEEADGWLSNNNIFGISEKSAWAIKKELKETPTEKRDKEKYRIEFTKHFTSSDEMNKELDNSTDSLFHVHSQFEKKFRWFYTYIRYSETIRPINRFKMVSPQDFFNREDSLFIQRLPAEGQPISKADSLYLQMLNEKITGRFANMAIFREVYNNLTEVIVRNSLDKKWLDSLSKKEEAIYKMIEQDQGGFEKIAGKVFETLHIPLPQQKVNEDFQELSQDLKRRTDFMSFARDGKYLNIFEMPWSVVSSNADSIAGNNLYWRPLVNKFVFMDYEMYAESRQMNWWAMAISVVIVGATLVLLWRKPK